MHDPNEVIPGPLRPEEGDPPGDEKRGESPASDFERLFWPEGVAPIMADFDGETEG